MYFFIFLDSWKFVTRGHCSATMGDEVKKKDLIACQLHCDGETLHKLTFNGVTGGCKCCPKWSNVEQVDLDGVVFVREGTIQAINEMVLYCVKYYYLINQ